ncbi:TonB-dependent receptor plug domain-containing protein [Mucilaginibacter paludis]|nr:TonB-dependent receptor [Mucilaginibacter paludis]
MKKNYVVAVSLGLAQLVLHTTAGLAQSASKKQDTVKNLNEVVVTATRSPKKQSEIGRVVSVISREEIARSQGKTVPELLNNVAGITFSGAQNNMGISSSLFVRGSSTGNTLILIDGFPVNNASGIDGSYDLNAFSLEQIDHIEILKGSGSTLYGSDAVAAVINIITKHAKGQELTGDVQLSAGSYHTFKGSVGLIGTLNKTGIALNVSNTDSKGFPAATDTTGKQGFKNDAFHQQTVSLNLTQAVSSKFSLNGNFQTTYNTGDLPAGAFKDDKNYTYSNTLLFGGLGAKLLLPKGSLLLNVSQNTVWNNYLDEPSAANYNTGDLPAGAFKDDKNYTYSNTLLFGGLGAKLLLPKGSLLLNVSQNTVWNNYLDEPSAANYNTPYFSNNIGRITNSEIVFTDNLASFLDITSGANYKYSNTSQNNSYGSIDSKLANNNITSLYTSLFLKSGIFHMELGGRYNHHSQYGNNFTYTLNPSVLLADQFKVFATLASAYKTPTLYQLYSQYGNIGLKPEVTTSYEAGFDWQIIRNALSFNTVFFKRKTKDVIYFYTDASFNSFYKNGNKQDDQGFESELKLKVDNFTASTYAAYVTGTQTDENGVDTHNLLRRPRNTYGANVSYQFIKNLSVGVNYKYTGERSDTHYLDVYPYSRVEGLAAYNLFDLHIQANATKKLSLYVDLKNLFDKRYTDWIGYNTRGFNAYGGIKYLLD